MITISDNNPAWPAWFEEVKACLLEELSEESGIVRVEHIGSTAVPGLAAKPILDIHVVIGDESQLGRMIGQLAHLGYIYEGDRGVMGQEAFRRRGPDVPLRDPKRDWAPHHLYVSVEGGRELDRHLALRNHLREEEADREAYSALKRDLAGREGIDLEGYTAGKSEFIEGILAG